MANRRKKATLDQFLFTSDNYGKISYYYDRDLKLYKNNRLLLNVDYIFTVYICPITIRVRVIGKELYSGGKNEVVFFDNQYGTIDNAAEAARNALIKLGANVK